MAQVAGKAPEEERGHPTFYAYSEDPHAEKLAQALLHQCHTVCRAAGNAADPHWLCQRCGHRLEIQGYPIRGLDITAWAFETEQFTRSQRFGMDPLGASFG